MPIIEYREAEILCRDCQNRFVALVPHDAIESDQHGIIGWVPAKESTRDVTCPACGSAFVRPLQ
jgi:Zn finger protein HypA/HybF involved in hydrogenase expression